MSLINVVRFLRLPQTQPELLERVGVLMDHVEDIKTNSTMINMWQTTAVEPLTRKLPDSPYTEGDVLRAVGESL